MKINKKIKDQIQKVLFEFRLGLDDIEDQQKIRYSMFNTPGPVKEKESKDEEDLIKPSEISPVQLYSVSKNPDKEPDNVIELKNTLNHLLSDLGNNEISKKDISKIYNLVIDIIKKG